MIAFLTNLHPREVWDRIAETWTIERRIGGGRGDLAFSQGSMPVVICRDEEQLHGLELVNFYVIGDVPLSMQRTAWARTGRSKWPTDIDDSRHGDGKTVATKPDKSA
jgi:hypothetical protein